MLVNVVGGLIGAGLVRVASGFTFARAAIIAAIAGTMRRSGR
ncbi:hypothetical protein [Nonomuraea longispora]|nr:hypothetical protein [Nonomuraea longispora]